MALVGFFQNFLPKPLPFPILNNKNPAPVFGDEARSKQAQDWCAVVMVCVVRARYSFLS